MLREYVPRLKEEKCAVNSRETWARATASCVLEKTMACGKIAPMAVNHRVHSSTTQNASALLDCAMPKRTTRHCRLAKRCSLEFATQASPCIIEEGSLWSGVRYVEGVRALFRERLLHAVLRSRQHFDEAWAQWREQTRAKRALRWSKRLQAHEARMNARITKPKPIKVYRFVDRFQCNVANA
jgi:hypothetical protein